MTTAPVLEQHDPATLLADRNIRTARPDKGLIESVRTHGVLQPIVGYRTETGQVRIRYGHRRAAAAIEAERTLVDVIVAASEAAAADIDRILRQYDENTHREGLTAADQAGVVVELLDLGLSVDDVRKRTRLPKQAVAAARAVAGSAAARRAAAKDTSLTLDMAAAIAEFDGDQTAVKRLTAAANEGPGTFAHTAQRLRDEAESQARRAATAQKLTDAGITVLDDSPGWENRLTALMDDTGAELTAESHRDCPGHAATLHEQQQWKEFKPAGTTWETSWYCTDPKTHGHRKLTSARKSTEDATEERRQVIAGNKAWRAAQKVRRAWLRNELLTAKTLPDGAHGFIASSLASSTYNSAVTRALGSAQPMAHELLGLDAPASSYGDATAIGELVRTTSDQRAAILTFAMIIGAFEDAVSDQTWRDPKAHTRTARYLAALASWGYEPSDYEQAVIDAQPATETKGDSE